jgi:sugar/nucleoside kinase (ribokinase family)
MDRAFDVVTLGHAIVDVLARTDDALVAGLGLGKGTMTLVDDEASARIYAAIEPAAAVSGGSAANTAAGLASLGARTAFIGKVRDDDLGDTFVRDIRASGVAFDVAPATTGPATGRCLVLVTPDAEKTMCTNLGIGDLVAPGDVDPALVASAGIVYIEGYLCGLEHTDGTVAATLDAAAAGGTTVALSLSDPLWVQLHGADMAALLDRVDILFANEQEACLLVGADDVKAAAAVLAERCETVVVTRGAAGSVVSAGGAWVEIGAEPIDRVVDTTGAGDLYAAGYLFGHTRGLPPEDAARLGGLASAEVISHLGARPVRPLDRLAADAGYDI